MDIQFNYHDAAIDKIEYSLKENRLVLGITLYDFRKVDLIFDGVIGWSFSPFEYQIFFTRPKNL